MLEPLEVLNSMANNRNSLVNYFRSGRATVPPNQSTIAIQEALLPLELPH